MPDVLILYASTHGQVAKIATRIGGVVGASGAMSHVVDVRVGADPEVGAYDLVIAGASIHQGHHQREMVAWARKHAAALDRIPSAFFSVSLTAVDDTDEALLATRGYLDDFLEDTGWTPRMTASFAGALLYREYSLPTRLLMKLIMARGHHPTDMGEDTEYTDWDAVDTFARECAELLALHAAHSGR
jgi:menaquinone-dependent protoporphyrinogen oxidase